MGVYGGLWSLVMLLFVSAVVLVVTRYTSFYMNVDGREGVMRRWSGDDGDVSYRLTCRVEE